MATKNQPARLGIVTETGDKSNVSFRKADRFAESESASRTSYDFRNAALFVAGWVVIGILTAAFWLAVFAILWVVTP